MVDRRVYALAALLLTLLAGCGRDKKAHSNALTTLTTESQPVLAKLDAYMNGCLDQAERIFEIADRYSARYATDTPHAGDAGDADVVVPISPDPETCLEQIERVKDAAPALPEVEAAAAAYGRAMAAVFAATKARRHAALVTAFRDFDAAQGALFDQVFRVNHALRVDELARSQERNGRTYAVIADDMMLHGEALVRFGATRWDRLDSIDGAAMAAQVAQFEGLLDEMAEYVSREPKPVVHDASLRGWARWVQRATPPGPEPGMDRYGAVSPSARTYLIAAKQLAGRVNGPVPFSDAEKIMIAANNEAAVIGSPAAMIIAYNNLIAVYKP